MEQLLHYVWKHKLFPLRELRTTTGQIIEVIDTGLPNRHAGPDFFNAKIKIDGTLWVGNIEIHTSSSDWKRHGHHENRAYDSVILHVAEHVDDSVRRTNGESIPQLELPCPEHIRHNYARLHAADIHPPCHTILSSLSPLTVHSWLSALQSERYEQKVRQLCERWERLGRHWEDVLFVTLARGFGFGVNGEAFEAWAMLLNLRAVDKHRDNLLQIESIFFGQAGLLEKETGDSYYDGLRKEYRYLRRKFELTELDVSRWRFLRTRPDNFPHVRIAQLAHLYQRESLLFSRIMEAEKVEQVISLLNIQTSSYWENHYLFGKTSVKREKTFSLRSLRLLLINVIIPVLYAYGKYRGDDSLIERADRFLEGLPAEHNHIIRQWDTAGIRATTAADSQALIQLQTTYCDRKKCLYCRFGYEYLRRERASL
ncbi:MAG: DUF2851 family protein [Prevotellaceae bacterium]|jgi:hypothetical protein|nr:DUF2851 family protein [Prevotellaceae bacterium]